jgi:hypothetical protein
VKKYALIAAAILTVFCPAACDGGDVTAETTAPQETPQP